MNKIYSLFLIFLLPSCLNINSFDQGYLQKKVTDEVEIPIETYRGLMLISAKMNGVQGMFLFDNGASYSCVNQDFADRAKITFTSGGNISDGNNRKTSIKESTVDDIAIEDIHFKNTGVYLIDTKQFFPCKEEIDGIIGASVINKVNWLIDFKAEKMTISSNPFENGGIPFNIGISSNNSSFIAFYLNDQEVKAKVDFGYQGDLKLRAKEFKNSLKGFASQQNIGINSLSISGLGKSDTTYDIYEGITMRQAGKTLPFPPEINLTKNLKYKARIGTTFFRNYEVAVNSSEKQYLLRPYEEELSKSMHKSYGLALYLVKDTYRVIQLNPEQIKHTSISVMDEVLEIDGKPANRFTNHCEMRKYMAKKRENQETLYLRIQGKDKEWALPFIESSSIPLP